MTAKQGISITNNEYNEIENLLTTALNDTTRYPDKKGKEYEKVYDVVWSGDRQPGADGKLPAVGNTVDMETATWTNSIGESELLAVWTDPDFDPSVYQTATCANAIFFGAVGNGGADGVYTS